MPCEVLRKTYIDEATKLEAVWSTLLRPLEKPKRDVWFSAQPVGANKINSYMKELATLGGLECTNKRFANGNVRKATVHKLQKAGVSNNKIAAVTRHRNEQSLRDYAMADMQDHQHISSILSKPCAVAPPVFH